MDYLTLKFLHVAGACLFVGNNLVTPFWKLLADRTRQPAVVAHAQRLITLTDFVFTGGGIALLLGSGHAMIAMNPVLWQQAWLRLGYAAFGLSGVLWLGVLLPVQIRQARLARAFANGEAIPAEYWRLARVWNAVGVIASLLPLGTLLLMVLKR
jgi:uncharacterized membrane protein